MSVRVRTFLLEPFDILLHTTENGVNTLQARFSTWLRTLTEPARFLCWQMPATLEAKIASLDKAAAADDARRQALLVKYRRHFERLMRHPALLDFLIEAAKTFRTRRKKALMVDQQMSLFLDGRARFIFENCPIRVIFSQRQGMNVFRDDAAFAHLNQQHRDIIAQLPRCHSVLDIQDEGLWYVANVPTSGELARFQST